MLIDVAVFIVVLLSGFGIAKRFDVTPWNRRILQWLWAYHLLFGIVYWAYIAYGPGGDAISYWTLARDLPLSHIVSQMWTGPTFFVIAVCRPFSGLLGLSFFGGSMLFCLAGYLGIAFAYVTYERMVPLNSKIGNLSLFPFLFFLPNLHFWSSGVGKDTLLFLCITLFFFCLVTPKKKMAGLIVSLVLSYFVRPHITLFLIAAVGIGIVLDGRLKSYQKIVVTGVFLLCGIWVFDKMAAFLKIDEINSENLARFAQSRASDLSRANVGSAIDIGSYPWPLKLFTFLYRPLFFDARSPLALIASLENLLLLALSVRVLASRPLSAFRRGSFVIKAAIVFVLVGSVGCSMVMSNLGIILRQKNMFIPALYLFIGWTLALRNNQTNPPQKTSRWKNSSA